MIEAEYVSNPIHAELARHLSAHNIRMIGEGYSAPEVKAFLSGFAACYLDDIVGANESNDKRDKAKPQLPAGVFRTRSGNAYICFIGKKGQRAWLGTYETPEEAHEVYKAAHIELHGAASPYFAESAHEVINDRN